jgi:hypothetical protein
MAPFHTHTRVLTTSKGYLSSGSQCMPIRWPGVKRLTSQESGEGANQIAFMGSRRLANLLQRHQRPRLSR